MTIGNVKILSETVCSRGTVQRLAKKTCKGIENRTRILYNSNSPLFDKLGIISLEFPTDTLQKGAVEVNAEDFFSHYCNINTFRQEWNKLLATLRK